MGYREYENKPCAICGKIFPGHYGAKYCSVACKRTGDLRNACKRNAEKRRVVMDRKQKSQSLTEIAKAARAAGMQYGDYVAKFGL